MFQGRVHVIPSSLSYTFCCLLQIKKPIIERRRRDRINESLNQLKALVLEALNKDVSVIVHTPYGTRTVTIYNVDTWIT